MKYSFAANHSASTISGRNNFLSHFSGYIATIVMFMAVGIIAGKNFPEKFAFFLFSFGV
ncbi:MAG: hypothetical protein KKG06_10390 [Bacteroidetes bacterium]|nr:hypothetical protein [Bacteroidota bacterium]